MSLILLNDGLLVEVEAQKVLKMEAHDNQPREMSIQLNNKTLDSIGPTLLKVVQPFRSVWSELNKDMKIDSAEIELGFGFEMNGNVFLAQATGKANLVVKLKISEVKA